MPLPDALQPLVAVLTDPDRLVRAVARGRRRGAELDLRRVELRWVTLKAGTRLQVVSFDEWQSFTRNLTAQGARARVEELLALPFTSWHVEATDEVLSVQVTKKGKILVHRAAARPDSASAAVDGSHDRAKARLLSPDEPFLAALGITTADGQVRAARRDKLAQIEAFVRALEPVVEPAAEVARREGRSVHVVDLGCGNAYLSMATYHWLTAHHGLDVQVTGVDSKIQAREHNEAVAERLGWSGDMQFVEATIDDARPAGRADLVIALHACDTATDDALAQAVRWQAPVVLAAPCCHHDLQCQLKETGTVPAPYGLLARHGIVRERFADVLTDALRAGILRLHGYRVDVIEFVGSQHTPRNTLLRAVRTGAAPTPELVEEYEQLVAAWQVRPALAAALDA
ncbi:MAG: class I SAM-dependent methyltransferase [Mycobacteriales bacterium]